MCWSQMASTRQHNKSLVSGTIGAFRLCNDKWLVELDLQRTHCQADTMPLSCSLQALQVQCMTLVPTPSHHLAATD